MAVGLRARFSSKDIEKLFAEKLAMIEAAILSRFKRIGERFVNNARDNGNYVDQTGNLRSSIGYVILHNGTQIHENLKAYPASGKKTANKSKKAGSQKAKQMLDEVRKNYPRGFVLIVVAGMEYAAAVESKGKDVLTASSITAEQELREAMTDIGKKITKIKK